jgi:hypothetical protein
MEYVVNVQEGVVGMSLAYLPSDAAILSLMEICDQVPLRLPTM